MKTSTADIEKGDTARMSHSSSRREFLKTAFHGTAALAMSGCANTFLKAAHDSPGSKPNIIFILADDLGYGDLGCYGQREIQTPEIDKLAAEDMRFTDHYAGCTVCAPSRCSLMTGLHTGHSYVRGNREIQPMGQLPLPAETVTIAKLLKEADYNTALIGKWGLGGPESSGIPHKQGFDYFFGYLCQRHAHNYYPEFLFRNSQRVLLVGNKVADPRPDGAGVAVERAQYSHDLFVREALEFIKNNKDHPFFLYLAVTIPHANNEAGKKGMEVPDYGIYKDRDWPEPQKGYAAMISRLDRDIGILIRQLKELSIDKNTLIIFTSDNGPHKEGGSDPEFFDSSGPLRGTKRDLYEGGIRVPMIARWPGRIKPGTDSSHISAFWDFMPTFAELAEVDCPHNVDGISLLPTLLGGPAGQKKHEFLYLEFHEGGFKQAFRMGKWKAVRLGVDSKLELYNLKADISETDNVANSYPEIIGKIEEYLTNARTESQFWKI
jgi:arylsulfatase A-like enzyme